MKSEAWLAGHVGAFEFLGGVPQLVVPDNPTTATVRPTRGDAARVVNARYQQLADHYGTAIVPAQGAQAAGQGCGGEGRGRGQQAGDRLPGRGGVDEPGRSEHRHRRAGPGDQRGRSAAPTARPAGNGSQAEEAACLGPLPAERFEEVEWKEVKAGRNYHIACDSQYYSVPYALAGRLLRVRLSAARVTVFDGHDIVCEHRRLHGRKGQYSTLPEHVPAAAPRRRRAVVAALVHRPGPQLRPGHGRGDRADPRPPRDRGARLSGLPRTS
ncbi:MAG: hypothetical protein V9G10_12760 [Candidatus Nanopelagicales bacterium]